MLNNGIIYLYNIYNKSLKILYENFKYKLNTLQILVYYVIYRYYCIILYKIYLIINIYVIVSKTIRKNRSTKNDV